MAMRKEISIKWKDTEYRLLVTVEVIDRLEDSINLAQLNQRARNGDIRFSHVSKLIALVLREAGCKVTQEEVYESLHLNGSIKPLDLIPILNMIFDAVFPEPEKK